MVDDILVWIEKEGLGCDKMYTYVLPECCMVASYWAVGERRVATNSHTRYDLRDILYRWLIVPNRHGQGRLKEE